MASSARDNDIPAIVLPIYSHNSLNISRYLAMLSGWAMSTVYCLLVGVRDGNINTPRIAVCRLNTTHPHLANMHLQSAETTQDALMLTFVDVRLLREIITQKFFLFVWLDVF